MEGDAESVSRRFEHTFGHPPGGLGVGHARGGPRKPRHTCRSPRQGFFDAVGDHLGIVSVRVATIEVNRKHVPDPDANRRRSGALSRLRALCACLRAGRVGAGRPAPRVALRTARGSGGHSLSDRVVSRCTLVVSRCTLGGRRRRSLVIASQHPSSVVT